MLFYDFKKNFHELGCFSIHQVYTWKPGFDSSALTRWCAKGYVIKLRNGYYTFRDNDHIAGFDEFVANKIYSPSYISLRYALSHYGIIPEEIFQITSVSSLKTVTFRNDFGSFTYQKVKPNLMFGYERRTFLNSAIYFASVEKAILDFFYLYPFYTSGQDMIDLRFDEHVLKEKIITKLFYQYLDQYQNNQLNRRIKMFTNTYHL